MLEISIISRKIHYHPRTHHMIWDQNSFSFKARSCSWCFAGFWVFSFFGAWIAFYNDERKHQSPGYHTPTCLWYNDQWNQIDGFRCAFRTCAACGFNRLAHWKSGISVVAVYRFTPLHIQKNMNSQQDSSDEIKNLSLRFLCGLCRHWLLYLFSYCNRPEEFTTFTKHSNNLHLQKYRKFLRASNKQEFPW